MDVAMSSEGKREQGTSNQVDGAGTSEVAKPVAPAALKMVAANDVFNPALMKYYYTNFFPFRQMFRWLSYGVDSNSRGPNSDFFHRREFTFTLENDIFVRYMCFRDEVEFAREVMKRQPERIEIGPVYSARPSLRQQLQGDKFKALERELIFDIDLNDYDDIRTCCTGAKICVRCWAFINVAIKVLDRVLREDFGFQHILFVYSGRRGMHCWVSDEAARGMTNEARSGVVEYINAKSSDTSSDRGGPSGTGAHVVQMTRVMNALTVPIVPAFAKAYADLEDRFVSLVVAESGQGLLATPANWNKVLECIPDIVVPGNFAGGGSTDFTLKSALSDGWQNAKTAEKRWDMLKVTVNSLIGNLGGPSRGSGAQGGKKIPPELAATKRTLEKLLPALVLSFCYPRLDVEVSKHRNHLLKAPFCIHPKTGRVCVPLTAAMADSFDPAQVPTVSQLMREGMTWNAAHPGEADGKVQDDDMTPAATGPGGAPMRGSGGAKLDSTLWQHTSLKPYVELYEAFLRELYAALRQARRDKAESTAVTGEW